MSNPFEKRKQWVKKRDALKSIEPKDGYMFERKDDTLHMSTEDCEGCLCFSGGIDADPEMVEKIRDACNEWLVFNARNEND